MPDRESPPVTDAAAAPVRPQAALAGALMMVAAVVCFTSLDSILKLLVARHDVLFLAWGRNLFQVAYMAALMPVLGGRRMVTTRHPGMQLGRGALLVSTTVLIVLSLKVLPLAQTYAITFSTPFLAVLMARLFLGETVSLRRLAWIAAGFVGVLIALRPGAPDAGWHLLLPVGMAFANALYHVLTRAIAADEDPFAMVFLVAAVATVLTALALPWTWSAMAPWEWGLLALGAAFGTAAHMLLVAAFRIAPTSVVSPMVYTQIVSALILGYLMFGEVPTVTTLLGAGLVTLCGIGLIRTGR